MEFARMNGMDRWFSKRETFQNTSAALEKLLIRAGLDKTTAKNLINKYRSEDGSIKCRQAVELIKEATSMIKRVNPEISTGKTTHDALAKAGISLNSDPFSNPSPLIDPNKTKDKNAGAHGFVTEAEQDGRPCMFKKLDRPIEILTSEKGELHRGRQMDANHLAKGIIPGVIAPKSYLVKVTTPGTNEKQYHVVTAGRGFTEFCKNIPNGRDVSMLGVVMDKAEGTRMHEASITSENLTGVAKGFGSILMNASSHGIVFGDIKPENAFVNGDKVQLIDTDGALKRSKWASKNPENFEMAYTYPFPAPGCRTGLQQDLWSVGFSLLEKSRPENRVALHNVWKAPEKPKPNHQDVLDGAPMVSPKIVIPSEQNVTERIHTALQGAPPAGTVEDFAILCIKTAMSQTKQPYTKRFTGEGPHLLDPILSHPVIGGRETFIKENLLKNSQSAQTGLGSPLLKPNQNDDLILKEKPADGGFVDKSSQRPLEGKPNNNPLSGLTNLEMYEKVNGRKGSQGNEDDSDDEDF